MCRSTPTVSGIAQLYRFGRVQQHTEHGGQVWLEADVPRRLWSRLQPGRPG